MKPLIDGDILLHELGWSGEFKDKETGEVVLFDFDKVQELLDDKIKFICEEVEATEAPRIYITNTEWLVEQANNRNKWTGGPYLEYEPVFRYEVAVSKPYKGTRKNPKPFHFYNITAYLLSNYDVQVSYDGLEADDCMCIDQYSRIQEGHTDTVICSRDKDLRICPGWHYSWECGNQASIGPTFTDELGWLDFNGEKTIGYGKAFFYYQMLVGDTADNIPGLPKYGDAAAKKMFAEPMSEEEMLEAVKNAYKESPHIENPKEYFLEQANLLWMRMDGPYKLRNK